MTSRFSRDFRARVFIKHKSKLIPWLLCFQISAAIVCKENILIWCVLRVKTPFSNFSSEVWTGFWSCWSEKSKTTIKITNKINNNNSSNFRGNAFSFKRYSGWRKKKCGLFNLFTENTFCQENADGRYPDMYNCCKFIRCSNGIPRQRSCPLGLMFNSTLKTCDWPENVLCQG